MMKIIADSKIPYLKGLLEPVAQEVLYVPGSEINNEVLRDAKVLLTRTRTHCDQSLLEGTAVEFIGTATIGTDHIDLDYCRQHGITVVNAPGCNAPAVAQWTHASILQWLEAQRTPLGHQLTLGIVGVGHVGGIVARWAHQLGYRVILNDPPLAEELCNVDVHSSSPSKIEGVGGSMNDCSLCIMNSALKNSPLSTLHSKQTLLENQAQPSLSSFLFPLPALMSASDIITFHTPLTREGKYPTWHLCDEQFLNSLQRCKLIINAARGAVCDNEALLRWHGDVALDCWEGEPNINHELLDKAFIATPHIAGYSLQGKQRGTAMIIKALNRRYGWNIQPVQASTPLKGAEYVTPQSILDSYNPLIDTAQLKSTPSSFESLRNNYLLRNELP
jgi:erythronate-4-phosphate dehydrogenase